MVIECATIVLIIAMISFIFLRTKRINYAFVTLPLLTIPLMHLLGQAIVYFVTEKLDHLINVTIILSCDVLGLLVGALLLGILLHKIPAKKAQVSFAVVAAVFMVALSIVLMTSLIGW